MLKRFISSDPLVLAACPCSMHCVTFNPVEHRVLATANAKEGLALWDIRVPQKLVIFADFSYYYIFSFCVSIVLLLITSLDSYCKTYRM